MDMQRYFASNTVYPFKARKKGIMGKVYVDFVVEKDGRITQVKVAKSTHKLLDKEAVRVVRSMPNWEPAINDGRPVRMHFTVPISFKLQ
ncbi:TonB family protein [bacterium]|nr:TonB family protein [bacterium]